MGKLLLIGIIGFLAQLVDGALGMAYGVSSTTLLLTMGIAPAVASATVHLAEVGDRRRLGVSHWRFGNVDWRTVRLMRLPGFIGAFLGAVALSSLSAEAAEPFMAGFLFLLGIYVLVRFSLRRRVEGRGSRAGRIKLPVRIGAAGRVRRLHGCRRAAGMGADQHARAAQLRADGAAQGRRLGRHRRVPRRRSVPRSAS